MGLQHLSRRLAVHALILGVFLLAGGCGSTSTVGPPPSDPTFTNDEATRPFDALPLDAPRLQEVEPNDSLTESSATGAVIDQGLFIDGRLSSTDDLDVFELGPLDSGDLVSVRIETSAEVFLKAALFDGDGGLLTPGFCAATESGNLLTMSHATRLASRGCSLALAACGLRFNAVGDYETMVVFERHQPVPPPTTQRVLLNFAGEAAAASTSFADTSIDPFDAAVISPQFAGYSDQIAEMVVEMVRESFLDLHVTVIASWEALEPAKHLSVVHLGAADDSVLGLAENVDAYNADPEDEAVVFVDAFSQFMVLEPSVEEIATALANVTTHEIGHLLGLEHTRGPKSVMDVSASLGHLVRRRSFGTFPLDAALFPLGQQDSPGILLQAVGGDAASLAERLADESSDEPGRVLPDDTETCPVAYPVVPWCSCGLGGRAPAEQP